MIHIGVRPFAAGCAAGADGDFVAAGASAGWAVWRRRSSWRRWSSCCALSLLGGVLRLPVILQAVAKLVEILLFFAGEDYGFGPQAVAQGVQANGGLACECFGAGRPQRVATVGLDLFECSHIFFGGTEPNWVVVSIARIAR
jgi:hypothetical protein